MSSDKSDNRNPWGVAIEINQQKLAAMGAQMVHVKGTNGREDKFFLEFEMATDGIEMLNPAFAAEIEEKLGKRAKLEMQEQLIEAFASVLLMSAAVR